MRKIMTVMLVALMMTLCSSCAQPAPEEEGKGILLEITMEEIVHANSTAALREAYDNFYIKYTYADGTKDARYVDDDLILMDFPDYDVAYTQDKCFYHAGGRYFGLFFAGVEQDLAWSDWLTVDEVGTLEETILEAYAENGKIYMTTLLPREHYEKEVPDPETVEKVTVTYVLDEETYTILESDTIYHYVSGKTEIIHCEMEVNVEEPISLAGMRRHINAQGDVRTLTIVMDPDTEKETTYSVSVLREDELEFFYPADYSEVYIDRACTIPVTNELNTDQDVTVYVKYVGNPIVSMDLQK